MYMDTGFQRVQLRVAGYSAVTPGFHINVMIVVFTPETVECYMWPPVSMRLS